MRNMPPLIALVLMLVAAACSDESATSDCQATVINQALAAAAPGDTVRVGTCRVSGPLTVPAGVTLQGQSRDATVIVGRGDDAAIVLEPGQSTARVTELRVESDGSIGILVRGQGNVELAQITVEATRGVGIGVQDVTQLTLSDVTLTGPVTADNVEGLGTSPTPDTIATHGLVLVDVDEATVNDVTVTGFAGFGALLIRSQTTWTGGGAMGNLSTGLMVESGSATLVDLELSETYQGVGLFPAYGAVFSAGAVIESTDLSVSNCEGVGLLHDQVSATHVDLVANDNGDAAVWLQRSNGLELSGTGTQLVGNRFAGVVIVNSSNVTIRDATIEGTRATTRIFEDRAVEVGDGVQLVGSTESIVLDGLRLDDNARVALLIDLEGGTTEDIAITDVEVDGSGEQLGVVAQGGELGQGWDDGVTRLGDIATNDAEFDGELITVGLVGPNDVPAPSQVSEGGLDALVGPND